MLKHRHSILERITLNITIPADTTPDTYTITVIANSTIGQDATVLYITVPDLRAPIINSATYSNITYGENETITVNATDDKQVDKCLINHNNTNITMQGCTYTYVPNAIGQITFTVYVNDTSGNINQTTGQFTVTDNNPPNITSHAINPKAVITSRNVSMTMTATDNYVLNYTWANITLPNQNSAILLLPANYTTSISGRYNITFYANDSSGNTANSTDYFIAESVFILNGTVSDSNLSGIAANITFYFPESEEIINSTQSTGNYTIRVPEYIYDIKLSLENSTELKLNEVNISGNNGKNLTIDTPSVQGYLKTIALKTTYTFMNATITLPYNSTPYTNEDYLSIYKCSIWNFPNSICASSWQSYLNATQNKTEKKYYIRASTFSAYSIHQDSYCGDAICSTDESCSTCIQDCGTCSASSGTCKKGISISLDNKTIYENTPVNVTLTIMNTGTCTLYDSGISAEWSYGKSKTSLGDISRYDSVNISLELDVPKSGEYELIIRFLSQNYDADNNLPFSVAAIPQVQKSVSQTSTIEPDTTVNDTQPPEESITPGKENKTSQPKQSEKKTPDKETPVIKPVNYTPALILIIAILLASAIVLWPYLAKTKDTNK